VGLGRRGFRPAPLCSTGGAIGLLAWVWLVAAHPVRVEAHSRGLYRTRAEAEQRARVLGCSGTHRNGDQWMPCRDEASLHRAMRDHDP
jgi:hypothetical protein